MCIYTIYMHDCCGLSVCAPQNSYFEAPIPSMAILGIIILSTTDNSLDTPKNEYHLMIL
jgi:hypothetical protein